MKNQYYPASPMINFIIEILVGAARTYPVALSIPLVFGLLWSVSCGFVRCFDLLKRGGKLTLLLVSGAVLSTVVFLFLAAGLVGGGALGVLGQILMIALILCAGGMYYGTIPALIFLTMKESRKHG